MGRAALLGVATGLFLWSSTAFFAETGSRLSLTLHLLANSLVFVDLFDLLARLYLIRLRGERGVVGATGVPESLLPQETRAMHLQEYAFVLSVHGLGDGVFDVMRALEPYRERVWMIDDASTDHTVSRLRRSGWRCLRVERNCKKPGALRQLLKALPREIETVIVLDPDVVILNRSSALLSNLEETIFDFQRSEAAAFSPDVGVHDGNVMARLQSFEYALALQLGRGSLGSCSALSGVGVYRRRSLEAVFARHSMSVYAEDLESALILLARGEKIYFDERLRMMTEAKTRLPEWFSQRVGWSFGLLKVYVERFPEILRIASRGPFAAYQYLVYLGVFCIAMLPLKLAALLLLATSLLNGFDQLLGADLIPDSSWTAPSIFADVYCKYLLYVGLALAFVIPRESRPRLAFVVAASFPFYVAAQSLATAVGFANWIGIRFFGRRLYHDHYDARPRLGAPCRAWLDPEGETA